MVVFPEHEFVLRHGQSDFPGRHFRTDDAGVDLAQMRYRNMSGIQAHIERAHRASLEYLKERA